MAAAGARAAYKTARKSEAVGENRPNIHANKSASKRARETPAICTLRSHSLSLSTISCALPLLFFPPSSILSPSFLVSLVYCVNSKNFLIYLCLQS